MCERLRWNMEVSKECMLVDGVALLNHCICFCNDGTTSLRGRFSLVIAAGGQLRRR